MAILFREPAKRRSMTSRSTLGTQTKSAVCQARGRNTIATVRDFLSCSGHAVFLSRRPCSSPSTDPGLPEDAKPTSRTCGRPVTPILMPCRDSSSSTSAKAPNPEASHSVGKPRRVRSMDPIRSLPRCTSAGRRAHAALSRTSPVRGVRRLPDSCKQKHRCGRINGRTAGEVVVAAEELSACRS